MARAERFELHMSDEDALMWNIEKDPVLRSTIVAVGVFDSVPDWDRLRRRVDRGTRLIPRLRQRVQSPPLRLGPPRWSTEPAFDLDYHLRRVRLPGPGTWRELLDAIQPIAAAGFDRARPLWEFTLFEGLTGPEGDRAAIVLKVHHAVTDGVGGMELLTHLVDLAPDTPEPDASRLPPVAAGEHLGALELVRESVGHARRRAVGIASRIPGRARAAVAATLRDPVGAATETIRTTRSVARTIAPASAPLSPVMRERGLRRHLATFDIALDDLRRAAKAADCTVNDAFVAAVIGGARHYHERHDAAPDALRMTLPINLRGGSDGPGGNRFAPARFPVPAHIADPH
ncbi:MAG: wax ester/triacylglycerol synthase domain-containing protein, partial [Actinomycetota bacterium]